MKDKSIQSLWMSSQSESRNDPCQIVPRRTKLGHLGEQLILEIDNRKSPNLDKETQEFCGDLGHPDKRDCDSDVHRRTTRFDFSHPATSDDPTFDWE